MPPPETAELSLTLPAHETDPELEALPQPRRPGRRLTLGALGVTAGVSLGMLVGLGSDALYATRSGQPAEIGDLARFDGGGSRARVGSWVHGEGLLGTQGAIRYARPLEADTFRLAPVEGNPKLWVEIRVPAGEEGPRFVAPSSFVGRLLPFRWAGLRHAGLGAEVRAASQREIPSDAWLLIDGESPASVRWALGLVGLFFGFASFNVFGLYRLLRPVRDQAEHATSAPR